MRFLHLFGIHDWVYDYQRSFTYLHRVCRICGKVQFKERFGRNDKWMDK